MNSFISILDAFCACIASLTLIILSLKFVSKRLKFKKIDKLLPASTFGEILANNFP